MKRPGQPPRRAWIRRRSTHTAGSPLRSPRTPRKGRSRDKHTANWLRVYGSLERVAWIKLRGCAVRDRMCDGPIQNAHTANGGISRKADADTIIPLCQWHHRQLHHLGAETFQRGHAIDLKALARATQAAWLTYTGVAA